LKIRKSWKVTPDLVQIQLIGWVEATWDALVLLFSSKELTCLNYCTMFKIGGQAY